MANSTGTCGKCSGGMRVRTDPAVLTDGTHVSVEYYDACNCWMDEFTCVSCSKQFKRWQGGTEDMKCSDCAPWYVSAQ